MGKFVIDWDNRPKFEFYVVHWDPNAKKGVMWNIFNNIHVYESAYELTARHVRNKKKYPREKYEEDLLHTIQWQEWSRCEYEIMVGDLFETDPNKFEKWDAYKQTIPNIEFIADMCIKRYTAWKKVQKDN